MSNDKRSMPDDAIINLLKRLRPSPGERFQRRMADAPWMLNSTSRGSKMMSTRALRFVAVASLALILSLIVLLATPWGRTFAQELLRFFQSAPVEQFDVPAQVEPTNPDLLPTAMPPTFITVAEAEAQIGFDAKELPEVPSGLDFLGATVVPSLEMIQLNYNCTGGGCGLFIMQSRGGWQDTQWSAIPAAGAIESVTINDLPGEYVKGAFVVFAGDTQSTWNPNAPIQRLRWQDGGMYFEIEMAGDVEPAEWIDREALIGLAESLR
jgi:hypothetical protein